MKDKELEELRETLIQISRIGDHWDCDDSCAESWELTEYAKAIKDLIAQERRKAKIEQLEQVSNRLDDFHQGTEGAGWVHYGEMGEWLDDELAELKEDKE